MVNAKYGNEPGLKAYTHVNDQFASQTIPATVSEAPYILVGLLMNETRQQLGYRLVLRSAICLRCSARLAESVSASSSV